MTNLYSLELLIYKKKPLQFKVQRTLNHQNLIIKKYFRFKISIKICTLHNYIIIFICN